MEQPKDYVVQSFDEAVEEAYKSLNFVEKIVYQLQDYVIPAIIISFIVGYLAGAYFGKFW